MLTGYQHPDYAASFRAHGTPVLLPASQGWILKRQIPGTSLSDGMGPYPLFCCTNWSGIAQDLPGLREDFVSLVLVADPLGDHSPEILESAFDLVVPFKDHYIVEAGQPLETFVKRTHRARARRALKVIDVDICPEPLAFLDEWERLYAVLIARRSITGLRRFSRAAFEMQFKVPGLVMFRASIGGTTIGLNLWYVQGECAQFHLGAFDERGYRLSASYAMKWRVLEYFNSRVRLINLGSGTTRDKDDGLIRFKRGWATGTRTAWLCGTVLQPAAYADILAATAAPKGDYFPAYRHGEFS